MPALEFCLPPDDLTALLRRPEFGRRGGRAVATELVWYDTAEGALAANHLSLCHSVSGWRLEQASPRPDDIWSPGLPPRLVAEAADLSEMGPLPGPLMPLAGFRGKSRTIQLATDAPATLTVLTGLVRGVAQEQPACRLVLEGPAPLLARLGMDWAASAAIAIPACSLATQAMALARGTAPQPRRKAGPEIGPNLCVADAIAHISGHLAEVILSGVPAASLGQSDEPVHAMRVALRRLRSALSVFRRVADGPDLVQLKHQLGELAKVLGEARDWDVFLAGTGVDLVAAIPDDARIQGLLDTAARRRKTAYAGLRREFASPGFRQLAVGLVQFAALRPWQDDADEERSLRLAADIRSFATSVLSRQHRALMTPGPKIASLPTADLHDLRKQGKRLRYTAEFFAGLYDGNRTRRFLRRLSHVQEALGHLNDGAAAAQLMQALRGGADRQFAIGAVQGFTAAHGAGSRAAIGQSWAKLWHTKPFWL